MMSDYERERAVMDSYLANAQEATFRGFDDSVQKERFAGPMRSLLACVYRMGFESGWHSRGTSDARAQSHLTERDREAVENMHGHFSALLEVWEDRARPKAERHYQDGAMDLQAGYSRQWLNSIEAEWACALFKPSVPAGVGESQNGSRADVTRNGGV
jgi:hypothetical protein